MRDVKPPPPHLVPDLTVSLTVEHDEVLREAMSLAEPDTIAWLDSSMKEGQLVFKPSERETRARVLADLARQHRRNRTLHRALSMLSREVASTSLIMETDLRHCTRDTERCKTLVQIAVEESNHPRSDHIDWLRFGQATLRMDLFPVELRAYLPEGVTDPEHDSGYALILPLIGLELKYVSYHCTALEAFVAPRAEWDFRVPWPGYDPLAEAVPCTDSSCVSAHLIVPEESYTPYTDPDLYREVVGRHLQIQIGPERP